MISRFLIVVAVGALAGCASVEKPQAVIEARTVEIPISTPCAKGVAPAPGGYADDQLPLGAGQGDERYRLIAKANEQRKARLATVEPVMIVCSR